MGLLKNERCFSRKKNKNPENLLVGIYDVSKKTMRLFDEALTRAGQKPPEIEGEQTKMQCPFCRKGHLEVICIKKEALAEICWLIRYEFICTTNGCDWLFFWECTA